MCTFNCGHTAELKKNLFGRGNARVKRIVEYSNRKCLRCAVHAVEQHVRSLTEIDGSPLPEEFIVKKIAEKIVKLSQVYRMTVNNT